MTLQLYVKVSARYTELKFQLGLANPRFVISTRDENSKFYIIKIFSNFFFWDTSELVFLFSLNFLFTRDYYISTRVKIFSFSYNLYHITAVLFNSVYRVEISTRAENLHFNSLFSSLHHSFSRKTLDTIVELLFLSKLTCRIINSYLR